MTLSQSVRILKALADPTRLSIVDCLVNCDCDCCDSSRETPSMCLVDVRRAVPCAPNAMSRHLQQLRDAGIITTMARGRQVYAQINRSVYDEFIARLSPRLEKPRETINLKGGKA